MFTLVAATVFFAAFLLAAGTILGMFALYRDKMIAALLFEPIPQEAPVYRLRISAAARDRVPLRRCARWLAASSPPDPFSGAGGRLLTAHPRIGHHPERNGRQINGADEQQGEPGIGDEQRSQQARHRNGFQPDPLAQPES